MSEQQATSAGEGIVAVEARHAREAIASVLAGLGLTPRGAIDLRPVPFAGNWGLASSVCHALAGELVMADLERAGKLEGLSKKEAKQLAASATRDRAQALEAGVAADVALAAQHARRGWPR